MSNNGASIFNFSTTNMPYPSGDLYVDTNSWLDMEVPRAHGQAVENYLSGYLSQALTGSSTPIILWSSHNSLEFMQCIEVDVYKAEARNRGWDEKRWKDVEKIISVTDANRLHGAVQQRYDSIFGKFSSNIYEIDPNPHVMSTARFISSLYGVQIKDAIHLAYMWHEEENNLLTRDRRFQYIPGLNIYSSELTTNGRQSYPISAFMPELSKILKR